MGTSSEPSVLIPSHEAASLKTEGATPVTRPHAGPGVTVEREKPNLRTLTLGDRRRGETTRRR